ncbi:MAG: rapZ [Burkholderiaceae bacterium]|nr:rapZ [Burkholderiaceae bacterium]
MHIVLITGISGSGKSVALNVLEDAGYFCVDNLPPLLLSKLVATFMNGDTPRLAVAVDSRSAALLSHLPENVRQLQQDGNDVKVLFLTADTQTLVTRFSETRRSHPLSHRGSDNVASRTLVEAIRAERELLGPIETLGHVIDTSGMSANRLRNWVKEFVDLERAPLTLYFESFAFKQGVPQDAALVFDVRALPNPHYDLALRPLTGRDADVAAFLDSQPEVAAMMDDIRAFVEKWLPSFKNDNRSYLTIAIGCTGGKHRSVYIAERLAQYFSAREQVLVRHRDLA